MSDIPYEQKLCEKVDASFMFNWFKTNPFRFNIDWDAVNCLDSSYRGLLLVLQGGMHYEMNPVETFNKLIRPVFTHPKFMQCACLGKLRFVWLGMHSQSRGLDALYERQSRENAAVFNDKIRQSFVDAGLVPGKDVLILDWMNMTEESQFSDGIHSMSDVNLAKAAQIMYLAEKWPFAEVGRRCPAYVNVTA